MAIGPSLNIRQTQSLVMTQQLQQAIKLLALSSIEVEQVIAEELAKNPLLEVKRDDRGEERSEDREYGGDEPVSEYKDSAEGMGSGDDGALDYDAQEAAADVDSYADLGTPANPDAEAFDFDRLEYREHSLAEHLLAQLHGASGPIAEGAEAIILALKDTGYLETPLGIVLAHLPLDDRDQRKALDLVQTLDPPGVGARNLAECLALQAKAADRYDPCMERLIQNLDLLAKGRMKDLKRICDVDDEDLADMVRELRSYDPKPGCTYAEAPAEAIVPDVIIAKTKAGWDVSLNPDALPRVLVNRDYHAQLKAGPQDKQSKAWLADNLASANWLVKALDQRAQTITKVAIEIVKQQQGFFEEGVSAMKPLTLARVAEAVDVHESTVSRVTSNKYLICDRGTFELKYFFGSGVGSADSEDGAAAEAVKAAIGKLIDEEDKILSDDALVGELKKQGYDLARRTVAKYREAMGIGSSVQRRRQRKLAGK